MTGVTFNEYLHAFYAEANLTQLKEYLRERNARVGIAWMYTESGSPDGKSKTGIWNPFGCVWKLTADTAPSGVASDDFNSVPVQNYHSMQDGLFATKLTILQSCCGFPRIVKRLRSKWATPDALLNAIVDSDWGTDSLIKLVYRDIAGGAYWARANTLVSGSY